MITSPAARPGRRDYHDLFGDREASGSGAIRSRSLDSSNCRLAAEVVSTIGLRAMRHQIGVD
jgi:hypothetical protein